MILQRTLFKHVEIISYSTIPINKSFDLSNKRTKIKEQSQKNMDFFPCFHTKSTQQNKSQKVNVQRKE